MLTQDLEGAHIGFALKPEENCEAHWKGQFSQTKLKQGGETEQHKRCTFKYTPGNGIIPYNHISFLKFRNEKPVNSPTTNDRCYKNAKKGDGYSHKLYYLSIRGSD